jgi:hypothetical protein
LRNGYFRNAVALGTGLTALFLLVHCTVEERDYTPLGIGQTAGTGGGGSGGSGGNGTGGTSAGQGGLGGLGGQGGAPVEPIPCNAVINDAGLSDAGLSDAGLSDAGLSAPGVNDAGLDAACACVDGFIRAVDADGDGDGTRECSVAPGLDCDDGDNAVTHNSCGGCTALPNAVGEDCLDCGSYACGGPDTLVCATKPDAVVVDPDCQCQEGAIAARDTDGDGQGTRLCEANPGRDCNDGDNSFITDVCGGCETSLPAVGGGCNECGVYSCVGTALACVPNPATPTQCLSSTTRQSCINDGFWGSNVGCAHGCYARVCAPCTPGTFMCTGASLYKCLESASTGIVSWNSWESCSSSTPVCNATLGQCTGSLLLPRDETFDVVPLLRPSLPWHDILNTASDSDYG